MERVEFESNWRCAGPFSDHTAIVILTKGRAVAGLNS